MPVSPRVIAGRRVVLRAYRCGQRGVPAERRRDLRLGVAIVLLVLYGLYVKAHFAAEARVAR
jgi:hypothetical protein